MKTFQVRLNIPTAMWALIEVKARTRAEAAKQALRDNEKGLVSYEHTGFDNLYAEVVDVEEVESSKPPRTSHHHRGGRENFKTRKQTIVDH